MIVSAPSKNLVAIPRRALTHIQNTVPGPPTTMAMATPAMLPMPTVALMAPKRACRELISPSPLPPLRRRALIESPKCRSDTALE